MVTTRSTALALIAAVQDGHREMVRYLLQACGIDPKEIAVMFLIIDINKGVDAPYLCDATIIHSLQHSGIDPQTIDALFGQLLHAVPTVSITPPTTVPVPPVSSTPPTTVPVSHITPTPSLRTSLPYYTCLQLPPDRTHSCRCQLDWRPR
jgi:hypothetical protein